MSATSLRIVSVFGATGLQGGAVLDGLLEDGTFTPRAITRDPDSEASKKLKARGVEVVKGDPLDKAELVTALRGSEGVFAMTMPSFTGQQSEITQGKNMVDAAREVGVRFFIFSSLPSLAKMSGGKYPNAYQYDDKAAIQEYLESSGLMNASLLLPAFLENYWKANAMTPKASKGFQESYQTSSKMPKATNAVPIAPNGYQVSLPSFQADDLQGFCWIGRDLPATVLGLLKNYADPTKQINGKAYPVVNDRVSYGKLAEMTAKVLGKEVTYVTAPPTQIPALDDMWSALAEYSGLYTETPIPNPDLVALGVKFSTVEEFLQTEVKSRYGH
ncbi:NmrA domain-containing protein [Favolaschia claudopus]|uniref:NmrA domain-containing protein n=1 Tax=Favolaschia claudopus TaxID=2862362 RepID=A0AAW0AZ34_9AGAR